MIIKCKRLPLKGKALALPVITANKYAHRIGILYGNMMREVEEEVSILINSSITTDASIVSQIRILLARLAKKHEAIMGGTLSDAARIMLSQVNRVSLASTASSIRELSDEVVVKPDLLTGELKESFKALTQQNVSLFKTIAPKYFSDVETNVIDSLTTGRGLFDLNKFFSSYSNKTKNYAQNRAIDQTRKAFTSINMVRLKGAGIKKVQWVHSHSSNDPRKLHLKLDGNVYSLDKPPFIGILYGQDVYGFGGILPYCRCTVKPVLEI